MASFSAVLLPTVSITSGHYIQNYYMKIFRNNQFLSFMLNAILGNVVKPGLSYHGCELFLYPMHSFCLCYLHCLGFQIDRHCFISHHEETDHFFFLNKRAFLGRDYVSFSTVCYYSCFSILLLELIFYYA